MYKNRYNIIKILVSRNEKMYLRQIQKETQLPLRSVQIELSKLEILKILLKEMALMGK